MRQAGRMQTRRLFSLSCGIRQAIACSVLMAVCLTAQASGPTGEEESLADLNSGYHPLNISPDGEWRVHVDERGVLHRVNLANADSTGKIAIPIAVRAMSVSAAADTVAISDGTCVGLVSFTRGASPQSGASLRWLKAEGAAPPACPAPNSPAKVSEGREDEQSGGRVYGVFSVALSRSGKYVALPGNPIRIIEAESGRVAFEIPTGAAHVLHLRFVDNDKKLLVVQAILGEQWESPAEGSDMQFAVWDLQARSLFSFHNTQTTGTLTSYDFLWSFSDKTGELWAINTNGSYWDGPQKRSPIRPYAVDLKQCKPARKTQLELPSGGGWIGFAADPMGRWVAIVEEDFDAAKKRATSRLVVRNRLDGHVLVQWPLDSEIRSLTSTPDGEKLYATTSGQPAASQMQYTRVAWSFEGGGAVLEFSLRKVLEGFASAPVTEWPAQRCMLEDESAQARDISIDDRPRPLLFEIRLTDAHERRAQSAGGGTCLGDQTNTYIEHARSWGGNGERLWVDRGATLEQISLVDGHVEQTLPTPRASNRCSIPLYEHEQFLSWEGDAVTLRPFTDAANAQRVLIKRPGWIASSVTWFGDRVGVRWIKPSTSAAAGEDENEGEEKEGVRGAEGSALAILYDYASGDVLKQVEGFELDNMAHFPGEDEEGGEDPFAYSRPEGGRKIDSAVSAYEWSLSYSGSVRARSLKSVSKEWQTMFWDGLRLDASLTDAPDPSRVDQRTVLGLGGSIGALIRRDDVVLFDAEKRQRLTGFPNMGVSAARWYPGHKILVVGGLQRVIKKKGGGDYVPMLQVYALDVPQNLLGQVGMIKNRLSRDGSSVIDNLQDAGFSVANYLVDRGVRVYKFLRYGISTVEMAVFVFLLVLLVTLIYIRKRMQPAQ